MRHYVILFTKINVYVRVYESTLTIISFPDLILRVTIKFLFSKKYVIVSNLFGSGDDD